MQIELEVYNPRVEEELSVHGIEFKHVGCGSVSHRREMETNKHMLTCACGLEIRFEQYGIASSAIINVTIDEEPRDLPIGSYHADPNTGVRIVHRAAA